MSDDRIPARLRGILRWLPVLLLVLAFVSVLGEAPTHLLIGTLAQPVEQATVQVGNQMPVPMDLPTVIDPLAPGTTVTVTATLSVEPHQSLLLKTVFAPLTVWLNGVQVASLGQPGSYPTMMNDPPTILYTVDLPAQGGEVMLRMQYKSPTQRNELSIPALYLGDRLGLFARLFVTDGFSFLFSLLLTFLGLVMVFFPLAFMRSSPEGKSFRWLGLFALASGVWGVGECDLTAYFIPYPSLLYLMAYLGLFCVTLTFLRFGLLVLQPRKALPLRVMLWVHIVSLCAAIVLQLTRTTDFTKSLYWFHLTAALGFLLFAGYLLWEHFAYHNRAARRFGVAIVLLSLAVVIEVLNYWLHFIYYFTLFFQLGVLAFVIALGVSSGYFIRESLRLGEEKAMLEKDMEQASQLLLLYKRQYESLTQTDQETRRQRHDLRHQLAVLRDLNLHAESEKLGHYLDDLLEALPGNPELRVCENHTVNAVAAYYLARAQSGGIDAEVRLRVPQDTGTLQEIDLCVVLGNLLENAVEACERMHSDHPFLHLYGMLEEGRLNLTCTNSFQGGLRESEGQFFSTKHTGPGMGIRSVQTVVKKYGGVAHFEPGEDTFLASVFIRTDIPQDDAPPPIKACDPNLST